MEIICQNDTFSPECLEFYSKNNIVTPVKDSIYNIRDIIKASATGETGVLLEEIKNPIVQFPHPILGKSQGEPNFNITRFAHLNGDNILRTEVQEWIQQTKIVKV